MSSSDEIQLEGAAPPLNTYDAQLADCQRMTPISWYGDSRTLDEICEILRKEVETLDPSLDYCMVQALTRRHQPLNWTDRYRWLASYAVTGGSEGYYVHVDLIRARENGGPRQLLLLKTFAGYDVAARLAGYIGARLGA